MLRSKAALTALLLAILTSLALAAGDDEIVKEFKKYFRKYKDSDTRVEAVLSLQGTETASVVAALVPILKDKDARVVEASIDVLSDFKEAAPISAVLERLENDKNEAVRVGLLRAVARGGYAGGEDVLLELVADRSWDVRRRAVSALAGTGDARAVDAIAPLCADKEVAVRCAALEGLSRLKSDKVLEPARASLVDASWQVRSVAIDALGRVRHKESIAPLIERMPLEEGRLKADLAEALAELTGRNFGQRHDLWERFWKNVGGRFEIPTDEELAKLREAQRKKKEEYKPGDGVSYHGIDTPSRSILFVIDTSGSMERQVVNKDRFVDGDYPSMRRMDIVKTELARTVERLEPYVEFNIIAFATKVETWKKKLVPANVLNKSSAADWAKRLEAIGGKSKEGLARVGLTGTANLEGGKTNTYDALMAALQVEDEKKKDYEVEVDTIFFLSDGEPSHGKFTESGDILREVQAANELRRIVVHTIAIGDFRKDFMRLLAEQNGGTFVDLGN